MATLVARNAYEGGPENASNTNIFKVAVEELWRDNPLSVFYILKSGIALVY